MNDNTSFLNKATGFFFGLGFSIAQLRYLPIPILTSYLTVASLLCCMVGYSLWFIESHLYPEHARKIDEWYSFAQYKEQYLLASVFGLVATTLSIAAIFVPFLVIPALWLLWSSNTIWAIGEYHKLNNPFPYDEHFSVEKQRSYFYYSSAMSSVAFISAISTTISFLFPPAALITMFIASCVCLGIGAVGAGYWLDYYFNHNKKSSEDRELSYEQMTNSLGISLVSDNTLSSAPYHGKGLYAPAIELMELDETPNPTQACVMP